MRKRPAAMGPEGCGRRRTAPAGRCPKRSSAMIDRASPRRQQSGISTSLRRTAGFPRNRSAWPPDGRATGLPKERAYPRGPDPRSKLRTFPRRHPSSPWGASAPGRPRATVVLMAALAPERAAGRPELRQGGRDTLHPILPPRTVRSRSRPVRGQRRQGSFARRGGDKYFWGAYQVGPAHSPRAKVAVRPSCACLPHQGDRSLWTASRGCH